LRGQGVFDSPSLTLVIGANIFKEILNTFKVIRYILKGIWSHILAWIKRIGWVIFTKKKKNPTGIISNAFLAF
jgi:hypothetical protein